MMHPHPAAAIRSRDDFPLALRRMRAARICEVGVWKGEHLAALVGSGAGEIVAVDSYCNDHLSNAGLEFPQSFHEQMYARLLVIQAAHPQVRPVRIKSIEAIKTFPDGYFDFVYIDADHAYAHVVEDMAWYAKVRKGGLFAGHDHQEKTLPNGVKFGVIQAVAEFSAKINRPYRILSCTSWIFGPKI